jgi:inner membrane protein
LDNLTHSLIGLIAGDCIARGLPEPPHAEMPHGERRLILLLLFVIGGNLPDIDLLLTLPAFSTDPLRYVLEHRGYTHTILGCCILALCLYAGVETWAWWRRRRLVPSQRALFLAAAVSGTLLHLGMDYLNSYGVHPLWPWHDGWLYGDSVFIVEPLYWVATAPLIFTVHSRTAKAILAIATTAGLALSLYLHPRQPVAATGMVLLMAALWMAGRFGTPRLAAVVSAVCATTVTAVFIFEGRVAVRTATYVAQAVLRGERVLDHVVTPVPTNPVCWDMLLLTTGSGTYRAVHGMLSTLPHWLDASDCPAMPGRSGSTTAPQLRVSALTSPEVHWLGQFSIPEQQLREVAASSCQTKELMQFVRAPFAIHLGNGWLLGDLRFDRGSRMGIAQIYAGTGAHTSCTIDAPWLPPRSDLLR